MIELCNAYDTSLSLYSLVTMLLHYIIVQRRKRDLRRKTSSVSDRRQVACSSKHQQGDSKQKSDAKDCFFVSAFKSLRDGRRRQTTATCPRNGVTVSGSNNSIVSGKSEKKTLLGGATTASDSAVHKSGASRKTLDVPNRGGIPGESMRRISTFPGSVQLANGARQGSQELPALIQPSGSGSNLDKMKNLDRLVTSSRRISKELAADLMAKNGERGSGGRMMLPRNSLAALFDRSSPETVQQTDNSKVNTTASASVASGAPVTGVPKHNFQVVTVETPRAKSPPKQVSPTSSPEKDISAKQLNQILMVASKRRVRSASGNGNNDKPLAFVKL